MRAFYHAFAGFAYALRSQTNMRTHVVIAALVVIAGCLAGLGRTSWIVLVLTIALVLALELVNTAIESLVDLVSPQPHPLARIAKDTAAAAVLVAAVGAVVVGCLVFLPPR
jgi:diacylglycerol kinase